MSANAARLDRARARAAARLSGWCEAGTCTDKNGDSTGRCMLKGCAHGCHQDSDAGVDVADSASTGAGVGTKAVTSASLREPDRPAPASDIKPGLHFNLPNDDYHSLTEWLSSSQLKALLPEHYDAYSGPGDALDFGTVFHAKALGTDETIEVHDFPTWRSKAADEAREAARAAGAVPILADDLTAIEAMVESLRQHEDAMRLLTQADAQPEVSAFTTDAEGVPVKARFDLLAPMAVDLKSTSARLSRYDLTRAIVNYGYDLSAAHCLDVAERLDLGVTGFRLIFVSKKRPHPVVVVELDEEFLSRGRALCALAKRRHLDPAEPRYEGATGELTLGAPGWARLTEPTSAGIPADFTWSIYDNA